MNAWLKDTLSRMTNGELREIYSEIESFRDTGILKEGKLRKLARDFSDYISHPRYTEYMRLIEDACLMEMAKRYVEICKTFNINA